MSNRTLMAAVLLGASAVVGCRTMERVKQDYNDNLSVGKYADAAAIVEEYATESGGDQLMWQLMSGSAYRLAGNGDGAVKRFDCAEDRMIEQDQTSVFGKATAGTWAMVTNDKAFDYDGGGQDRVFTCLYKAIDFAVAGNPDAARTEFNRAAQHQENWLYERRKDIASANERMKKDVDAYNKEKKIEAKDAADTGKSVDDAFGDAQFAAQINEKCGFDPRTSGILDNLQPVDWMNPYASHVTGVFRWLNGDEARNYFKDAATCRKDNAAAVRDFSECDQGVRPRNQVWIWVEDGLCPERREWRLDLPLIYVPYARHYVLYAGMALPYLEYRTAGADSWTVSAGGNPVAMDEIADVDKLTKLEYDVYMRGALAREITRVVVKAGAQAAMGIIADNSNDWRVKVAMRASQAAVAAWALSVTQADTRCWTSLPKRVHALRVDRPADGRIKINASCGTVAEITLPEGNSMVFVSKPGPYAKAVVKTVTYK